MRLTFLTYIARSGSTFLLHELEKRYDVFVFPEMGFLSGFLLKKPFENFNLTLKQRKRLVALQSKHHQLILWPIKQIVLCQNNRRSNFDVFIELLTEYAIRHKAKSQNWVFKQQFIPSLVEIAQKEFGNHINCNVISLIRDPRAILNSQIKAKKVFGQLFTSNPYYLASQWKLFYFSINSIPNNFVHKIRYEDLLNDLNTYVKEIADFIGVTKMDEKRIHESFLSRLSEKDLLLHKNVSSTPINFREYAWTSELHRKHIIILETLLKKPLTYNGYKQMNVPYNKPLLLFNILYYFIIAKFRYNKLLINFL